jgi:hypothetical protein
MSPRATRLPSDEFDFMVAGVSFEGRHRLIERYAGVGDHVRVVREPDNRHDKFAVAVTLIDGRKIGYVPRDEYESVWDCLDEVGHYVATVKKILTGGTFPIPVIVLQFYRSDQSPYPDHTKPDISLTTATAQLLLGCLRTLAHAVTSPIIWLLRAIRSPAILLANSAFLAGKSVVTWTLSLKDDLRSTPEREVHAGALIGKLLVLTVACAASSFYGSSSPFSHCRSQSKNVPAHRLGSRPHRGRTEEARAQVSPNLCGHGPGGGFGNFHFVVASPVVVPLDGQRDSHAGFAYDGASRDEF